ncbi:hypothetical protein BJ122_102280 [Rhodopseudomonas faecalis]|uniref:UrcA family protein n=1 Tax=Rhodopseudomonas faecalis TaxID=99655 RepID=A0A318TK85_9BRAD|nr:hypothetical protein BJ122_102280 [Rhodopseudomonas faecalis]
MICVGLLIMWCGAAEAAPAPAIRCPPLAVYSKRDQQAAAREVRAMPHGSRAARLIADYGTLRARCRAIAGGDGSGR